MSFAKPNPQRIPVMFLAALMWLVAMGPFLHIHVGASRITGFHVDGLASLTKTQSVDSTQSILSVIPEAESPALSIPTSHTKKASETSSLDSSALVVSFLLLAFSVYCGLFIRSLQSLFSPPPNIRHLMRHSLARLTHAPPTPTR